MTPRVFIALPHYGTGVACTRALVEAQRRHPDWPLSMVERQFSGLTENFNALVCEMLTWRHRARFTHFLMVHADVRPAGDDWLGTLISEMARVDADVLSVVIPLKAAGGLTSTALDTDPWQPRRLTLSEVRERPVTFTDDALLVNTGLMLWRIGDWCEHVHFRVRDAIVHEGGQWRAKFAPEDWEFSRDARALGLKLFATTAIGVEHVGAQVWARA